jgi:hypothetical protein
MGAALLVLLEGLVEYRGGLNGWMELEENLLELILRGIFEWIDGVLEL